MTQSIDIPYLVLVRRADPTFDQERRSEIEYSFSNGREFRRDPAKFGPYDLLVEFDGTGFSDEFQTAAAASKEP